MSSNTTTSPPAVTAIGLPLRVSGGGVSGGGDSAGGGDGEGVRRGSGGGEC